MLDCATRLVLDGRITHLFTGPSVGTRRANALARPLRRHAHYPRDNNKTNVSRRRRRANLQTLPLTGNAAGFAGMDAPPLTNYRGRLTHPYHDVPGV